ncbi:AglZ/HisF2 family acetamidino modification protein [Vibrio cortegadensis]|uniref:AglZ/HisF2 family acetamidino modification protein n=1 Tax=Vibrio cortegadensis TaxID=1328770 RepID=UPI0021C2CD7F|nr:AglZ/HisF2 family acetamidino modification protein [Vibrio cortegadensis]MDN3698361.1 AglZ/HisF2 family acetamidino modification protein [Vibrio cortegadensis]
MLKSRIIPVLLIRDKGLVKTTKFSDDKYVGDPLNAVRIFNEKEVDELTVFDIDATVNGTAPDLKVIEHLAAECRMPLCYGGGIKTLEQAQSILSLGVEKVALSSAAIETPQLISDIASQVGNQSVVVVLDVKKKLFGGYKAYTHNGTKPVKKDLFELLREFQALGAGEIIVNNIDLDGTQKGYDHQLICNLKSALNIPFTICGGASSYDDIGKVVRGHTPIGLAAGSLFVFKGKYRAVLISYPNKAEKELIYKM